MVTLDQDDRNALTGHIKQRLMKQAPLQIRHLPLGFLHSSESQLVKTWPEKMDTERICTYGQKSQQNFKQKKKRILTIPQNFKRMLVLWWWIGKPGQFALNRQCPRTYSQNRSGKMHERVVDSVLSLELSPGFVCVHVYLCAFGWIQSSSRF